MMFVGRAGRRPCSRRAGRPRRRRRTCPGLAGSRGRGRRCLGTVNVAGLADRHVGRGADERARAPVSRPRPPVVRRQRHRAPLVVTLPPASRPIARDRAGRDDARGRRGSGGDAAEHHGAAVDVVRRAPAGQRRPRALELRAARPARSAGSGPRGTVPCRRSRTRRWAWAKRQHDRALGSSSRCLARGAPRDERVDAEHAARAGDDERREHEEVDDVGARVPRVRVEAHREEQAERRSASRRSRRPSSTARAPCRCRPRARRARSRCRAAVE